MIGIKRSPFLPAFSIRASQDGPNTRDGQLMTAACFAGKLAVVGYRSWL